ncbi:hypothetical protein ACWIG5_14890 [Streptomyces lydicus]
MIPVNERRLAARGSGAYGERQDIGFSFVYCHQAFTDCGMGRYFLNSLIAPR